MHLAAEAGPMAVRAALAEGLLMKVAGEMSKAAGAVAFHVAIELGQ